MLKRSILLVLWSCVVLLCACGSCDAPTPPAQQSPLEIQTALSGLEKVINLPPGTRAGRWVAIPRGGAGLGPSDSALYVYIELDDEGLKAFGQPGGEAQATASIELPEKVARALLPPGLHPSANPMNGFWRIEGHEVDSQSLGRMPYRVDEAILVASGLLVTASTR